MKALDWVETSEKTNSRFWLVWLPDHISIVIILLHWTVSNSTNEILQWDLDIDSSLHCQNCSETEKEGFSCSLQLFLFVPCSRSPGCEI